MSASVVLGEGRACIWWGSRPLRSDKGLTDGGPAVDWQVEEMNETCDRCGPAVRAAYRVDRVGELYLCGHCASQQWRALSAQGWTFWPLGVHALAPQAGYDQVEDAA